MTQRKRESKRGSKYNKDVHVPVNLNLIAITLL